MTTEYEICCKNVDCLSPKVLPQLNYPDMSQHQVPWPKDGKPRNFLCPTCKHGYEYAVQDAHLHNDQEAKSRKDNIVVNIRVPCGKQGCVALIKICAIIKKDCADEAEMEALFATAELERVRCEKGHVSSRKLQGSSYGASLDLDWIAQ